MQLRIILNLKLFIMKAKIFYSILLVSILTSCSSAYKTSQTPDDVYYSPAEGNYYVEKEVKTEDEDYLRMKVRNNRFRTIDDYSYWNDVRLTYTNCYTNYPYNGVHNWNSYYYNNYNSWNNHIYYNSPCIGSNWYSFNYNPWGSWNSPFYYMVPYKNPTVYTGNTKASYVTAYTTKSYSNTNVKTGIKAGTSSTNRNTGFGKLVKRVFSTNGNTGSGNAGWDRPARTYTNSSGTTTSGSSSAGGRSGGYKSTGSSSSSSRSGRN